jgi:signal transduction histidine kinase
MLSVLNLENGASSLLALALLVIISPTVLLLLPRRDRTEQLFWLTPCLTLAAFESFTDTVPLEEIPLHLLAWSIALVVSVILARRMQQILDQATPLSHTVLICTAITLISTLSHAPGVAPQLHMVVSIAGLVAACCWPILAGVPQGILRGQWERAFLFSLLLGYAIVVLTEAFDDFPYGSTLYELEAASHFLGVVAAFVASCVALRHALRTNEHLAAAERLARLGQEEARRFLAGLIDTAPLGVYVKDLDGRYQLVNKVFAGWVDCKERSMLGNLDVDLFPPEIVAPVQELDAQVMETRKPQCAEMRIRRKNDVIERIVVNHKFPLFDCDGQLTAIAGLAVDVTQLKAHERELILARQAAEEANRAKSNFLAHMSHELRTPLNAIIGFSDVIERALFGADKLPLYQQYAGDINRAGNLLLSHVNDLLDISRIEAGSFDVTLQSLALASVADECCHLLHDLAKRREVSLEIDRDRPLPQAYCDRRATLQVLLNLAGNAIKHLPAGSRIRIAGGRTESGVDYFLVEDNGPGLPPKVLQALLDPWSQSAVVTEDGRSGMGLLLSRKLMEVQGGRLVVESSPGKGTRIACQFRGAMPENRAAVISHSA